MKILKKILSLFQYQGEEKTLSPEENYNQQFVKFILSDEYSRLKRLHLSFKVLLQARYNLILTLDILEKKLIQGSFSQLELQSLFKKTEKLLQCLNDVGMRQYLWLFSVLDQLKNETFAKLKAKQEYKAKKDPFPFFVPKNGKESLIRANKRGVTQRPFKKKILEDVSTFEENLKIYPLDLVNLSQKNLVGETAACLGEIKNFLNIPVPPTIITPDSEIAITSKVLEEINDFLLEWQSSRIVVRFSPFESWPWFPPQIELPIEQLKEGLFRLKEQVFYQLSQWRNLTGEELSPKGAIIIQKKINSALSGIYYTNGLFFPDKPLILVRKDTEFFQLSTEEFSGPRKAFRLLLDYAEIIFQNFKTPQIIEWEMDKDKRVYISQIFPYYQHPIVYPKINRQFVSSSASSLSQMPINETSEYLALWKKKISSLTITLPESEDLTVVSGPDDFKTLQDIILFAHEAAVRELFRLEEGNLHLLKDPRLPITFYLMDLGQGLRQRAAFRREITISDVISRPLKVLWHGMTHEGVSWKGTVEFNLGGFFSVLSRSFVQTTVTTEGGKGYFLITKEYLYLRLRLAYHLMHVEAYFKELDKSFLSFRLQGGGAGSFGRQQRFLLLKDILESLGFEVSITNDNIWALCLRPWDKKLENLLDQLGRLLGFTRQLDMTLQDKNTRKRYVEAFLKGYYSLLENESA